MKKLFFLLLVFITSVTANAHESSYFQRRAAIDVGSGSTKVSIADIDLRTGRIARMVFETSYPVPYQAKLETSYDGSFNREVQDLGLRTFHQINELNEEYEVESVVAVATAAFRNAINGESFAREVQEKTGIPLRVIPQREEGEIAYSSALAVVDEDSMDDVVVWDIGTGSFQITTRTLEEELSIFMGEWGSIPFRNYIIEVIQEKDLEEISTPNPIYDEELKAADRFARSIARKAYPVIKEKIRLLDGKVVGIGRLFYHSIGEIAQDKERVSRKDLRKYLAEVLEKSDEELDNPFAHVDISNAIMVLAYMKALHIHEICVVNTTSAKGMLIHAGYWM